MAGVFSLESWAVLNPHVWGRCAWNARQAAIRHLKALRASFGVGRNKMKHPSSAAAKWRMLVWNWNMRKSCPENVGAMECPSGIRESTFSHIDHPNAWEKIFSLSCMSNDTTSYRFRDPNTVWMHLAEGSQTHRISVYDLERDQRSSDVVNWVFVKENQQNFWDISSPMSFLVRPIPTEHVITVEVHGLPIDLSEGSMMLSMMLCHFDGKYDSNVFIKHPLLINSVHSTDTIRRREWEHLWSRSFIFWCYTLLRSSRGPVVGKARFISSQTETKEVPL